MRGINQTGLRPEPPASACGDPTAPRRSRRGALCAASIRRGCAPNPRRPLAGTPQPRAAPAEARCARHQSDGAAPRTPGVRLRGPHSPAPLPPRRAVRALGAWPLSVRRGVHRGLPSARARACGTLRRHDPDPHTDTARRPARAGAARRRGAGAGGRGARNPPRAAAAGRRSRGTSSRSCSARARSATARARWRRCRSSPTRRCARGRGPSAAAWWRARCRRGTSTGTSACSGSRTTHR